MIHQKLDISYWRKIFPLEKLRDDLQGKHPNMQLGGMAINSAFHIAVTEQLRDEALKGIEVHNNIPSDIFLWNIGDAPRREITKIGGLPYRARDKEWSKTKSGKPMTFVGQFNFSDSKDITGSLPGDILLIFAETNEYGFVWGGEEDSNFYFEWVSIGDFSLVSAYEIPKTLWSPTPVYGTIYRTSDYVNCDKYFSPYNSPDAVAILEATKIGGIPVWVQYPKRKLSDFLCSIASIEPAISGQHQGIKTKPFPYLNREEPIEFHEWYRSKVLRWGDMGILNISLNENGQVGWDIQNR